MSDSPLYNMMLLFFLSKQTLQSIGKKDLRSKGQDAGLNGMEEGRRWELEEEGIFEGKELLLQLRFAVCHW